MISCMKLQQAYIDLYKELRRFVWDFNVVMLIADLEVECYNAFPDIYRIVRIVEKLHSYLYPVIAEDEDLQSKFNSFKELIHSSDSIYVPLKQVVEVIDV